MVKAKKHLGQHFLTDKNIAQKIVDSLLFPELPVLEIGPGTGVLTQFLKPIYNNQLYLIEIDSESVDYLHDKYPELINRTYQADFLRVNLLDLFTEKFTIIGNFPYNISSQIFFKVLEYRDMIPCVVGMIQKEVAVRLASPPGSKEYGILSVLLQAFYQLEYLFTVSEHVFNPPPKVKSAVIRLTRNTRNHLECNEKMFFSVVKTSFNQRRKTIRNSLKSKFLNLATENEIFNLRPEQLSVDQFVFLTNLVEKQLKI